MGARHGPPSCWRPGAHPADLGRAADETFQIWFSNSTRESQASALSTYCTSIKLSEAATFKTVNCPRPVLARFVKIVAVGLKQGDTTNPACALFAFTRDKYTVEAPMAGQGAPRETSSMHLYAWYGIDMANADACCCRGPLRAHACALRGPCASPCPCAAGPEPHACAGAPGADAR